MGIRDICVRGLVERNLPGYVYHLFIATFVLYILKYNTSLSGAHGTNILHVRIIIVSTVEIILSMVDGQ